MTRLKKKLTLLIIALFAAICLGAGLFLLPSASPSAAAEVTLSAAEYFNVTADGVFTGLTDKGVKDVSGKKFNIIMPATVKEIGTGVSTDSPSQHALFGSVASNLVEVSFIDSTALTKIGEYAFRGCSSLESIALDEQSSLSDIGKGAFKGCSSLAKISLPTSVNTIAEELFSDCLSLRNIAFKNEEIKTIGAKAFENCIDLESFPLLNELEVIGDNAFNGCRILENIAFPDSLTTIGDNAFNGCRMLKDIVLPDLAVNIGASAFAYCAELKTVRISNGITEIKDGTFNNCTSLTRIYTDKGDTTSIFALPSNIDHIGREAFSACISLKEIVIPKTVTTINDRAFYSCSGATDIYFNAESCTLSNSNQYQTFGVVSSVFTAVTLHIGDADNQVKNLAPNLFSGHIGITKIEFNNVDLSGGVGENGWGVSTFNDCSSLKEIVFSEDCTIPIINASVFENCLNLVEIKGIENVKNLGTIMERAFANCRSLRTFTIGANVSDIKLEAFLGCSRLIEVKNLSTKDGIKDLKAQDGGYGRVASYALRVYKDAESESLVKTVGDYVFFDGRGEGNTGVYLIDYIGTGTDITLPDKFSGDAYNIYQDAFIGKTTLTHIIIPDLSQVKTIGDSAFAGCTSLERIVFPKTLTSIGNNLLQGCISLKDVNFSGVLIGTIPSSMFEGCSSLKEITLPSEVKTIENSAFENCSSLTSITFGGGLTGINKSEKLQRIGGLAFKGCSSLTLIEIPSTVTNVGMNAFDDCSALKFVYLPEKANYGANVFGAPKGESELMLISGGNLDSNSDPDMTKRKECYNRDKDSLVGYVKYLTYIVDVKLIYNDGVAINGVHTVKRLFNRSAGYEQMDGLGWNLSGRMPCEEASKDGITSFQNSVWYKTADYKIADKVEIDEFTKMLAEDSSEIFLYANYIAKPSLVEKSSTVVYDEAVSYDMERIFTELLAEKTAGNSTLNAIDASKFSEYKQKFQLSLSSHTFVNGTKNTNFKGIVADAGIYVLEIKLNDNYGTWSTSYEVSFTINPKPQDISKLVEWRTSGGGTLAPSYTYVPTNPVPSDKELDELADTLYFYDGGTTPFLTASTGTPTSTVKVLSSYVVFNETEIEILLRWTGGSYGTVGSYAGNKGTAAGTYTATAVIEPNNNYILSFTSDALTQKLGLNFSRTANGAVTVSKTWYIVASKQNRLIADGGGDYSFDSINDKGEVIDWVFSKDGFAYVPEAPKVLTGPTYSLLSFSLEFNGKLITEKEGDEDGRVKLTGPAVWAKYINASLPAGDYVLTFYIDPYKTDSGTIVGNSEGYRYEFTVKPAVVPNSDRNNVINTLKGKKSKEYTGQVTFIDTSELELFKKKMQFNDGVGFGYWKDHPEYYTEFEIRYYVVEAGKDYFDKNYYTADEYAKAYADGVTTRAFPVGLGTYTIYYIVSAPNYEGEITGSYTLNITHTLSKITIEDIPYTGVSVLPDIDAILRRGNSEIFDEYSFFDVFYLTEASRGNTPASLYSAYNLGESDSYIDVTTDSRRHYVFVSIKETHKEFILWDENISKNEFTTAFVKNVNRKFLVIQVKISATGDMETDDGKLFINSWEYGMFSRENNTPHWKLLLNTDETTYKFQLISAANGNIYYFNNDPDAELDGQGFIYAPAGTYTLKAISPANVEGGWGEFTSEIEIEVRKATLVFNEVPYIDSWNYGNLPANSNIGLPNLSEALAGFGNMISPQIKTYYCLRSDYDNNGAAAKLYDDLDKMKNSEGQLNAGEYYVIYRLAETDNFAEWEYRVRFKVLTANNSWKSLYVTDFAYGDTDKVSSFEIVPNYGNSSGVFIRYKEKGVDGAYKTLGGVANLSKLSELSVGQYELLITLPSTENYARMETSITFTISTAVNRWIDVPSIRGWAEGNFDKEKNGVIAKAALGNDSLEITITGSDGKTYNIHELSSLSIGTYKLTARVAGTNDYDELVSEIYFDVIEDSVGLTGLIAATVVFSVLALGLAGAAITLLVLRNKKAEREFRKAVRNELRRK